MTHLKITKAPISHQEFQKANSPARWADRAGASYRAAETLRKELAKKRYHAIQTTTWGEDHPLLIGPCPTPDEKFDALWTAIRVFSIDALPVLLLYGYAVEAASKALAIHLQPERVGNGKIDLESHRFPELLTKIGHPLPAEMESFAHAMVDVIVAVGKYPASIGAAASYEIKELNAFDAFDEARQLFQHIASILQTQSET